MVNQFLAYLSYERNRSLATVSSYRKDLEAFQKFVQAQDSTLLWADVDADLVRDWMAEMMNEGQRATSINRRLSALRSFYRFALARNLVKSDPVQGVVGPKKDKPLPQFLKEKEMDELLQEDFWTDCYEDVRDRMIIMTFYETGIRLAELMNLCDGDVDFMSGQLKVTGKRNKQRLIPFGAELSQALQHYMGVRDAQVVRHSAALFLANDGQQMTADAIRYRVKKHLSLVSTLKKRTPHVLRHTFATAMLNHKAGIESVKKLLGHESLSTTEIYTHTTFEQLKREYLNAHPRA
ncbi:tyrosine recombinase XerC [Segatella oulorum]|jgi:integrase/recombinase xerD|uniref:tyrosine recombinase XerC n=1 Tax=Segatella oulorum TaxID=28136 RepID=UPI0023F42899|nr:tyrosine recombinase XerC [Segatella oulorum]